MLTTLLSSFLNESLDLGLGLGGTGITVGLIMYFWKDIIRLIEKWMDKKKSKKESKKLKKVHEKK